MTITLRPYQQQAIDAVIADWDAGATDVLVTMATGLGKTAVFLSLLDRVLTDGKRGLVIAHRKELIDQPLARLISYYPRWMGKAGVVMADVDEPHKQLIIATIQTLASSPKRLAKILAYGKIDYLVIDECFVAGTLVDGRPIETIQIGDIVTAYDEKTRRMANGKVTQLFKRRAPFRLVRVTASGRQIICTYNHPILSRYGWIPAGELNENDEICTGGNDAAMRPMRAALSPESGSVLHLPEDGAGVLLEGVHSQTVISDDVSNEPEIRQRAHESKQSDEPARFAGENAHEAQRAFEGRLPGAEAREWHTDRTAKDARGRAALGRGSSDTDRPLARRERVSDGLQGGHWGLEAQDRNRGGWEKSQSARQEGGGPKENPVPGIARVDRVEILERGSDGEFERVCPDGYVYNLEVEDLHTYTANGLVVHNCHHVTDKNTYRKVLTTLREANPQMRHLGVTATPVRADGDGLGGVYQKESYHHGIIEGIRLGALAPVRWLAIQTSISVSGIKTVAGDFQQRGLANVFETQNCFDLVVATHQKYADGRQAAAFTVTVEGAYRLAEAFRAAGIPAAAADGTTDKRERAHILRDFQEGRTQVLCNVALWTEGLDVPQISCIHQVRPTKSDGLYTQIIGRALRTYPGKEDALILDYAPAETRNIAMMGDILGVPLRKESYVQSDRPEGDAAGGFTFDGNFKYLEGNPAEIISRQLDYLSISPWSWWRQDGWLSLGLGEASDSVERILLITPPDDNGELVLYGIARRITRQDEHENKGQWQAKELGRGSFGEVSEVADGVCGRYGNPSLAQKAKAWRKQPPSDAQIRFARQLKGAWKPGYTKGELAAAITHAQALRTVQGLTYVSMGAMA